MHVNNRLSQPVAQAIDAGPRCEFYWLMARSLLQLDSTDNQRAIGWNLVLGLLILFVVAALSFGAGYATRAAISRKRRTDYLKYEPYLGGQRMRQPPDLLIPGNTRSATSRNSDDRSSRGSGVRSPQKSLSERW